MLTDVALFQVLEVSSELWLLELVVDVEEPEVAASEVCELALEDVTPVCSDDECIRSAPTMPMPNAPAAITPVPRKRAVREEAVRAMESS
ncbi:hypothetical protein H7F30_00690 [Dermacoccus sp. PAMC28757]|uniref:hypothetical protein n=1 Tax=Dermacoccus sp. PAMC28757 TaxID=2762331 RepID=UPI00164D56F3|nr:hypothetical protein [Dermacoccus sp. PAMC28757]QNK52906.1 hypothetical protein H7F30_00690 [Dermacoccus sp. PAMC28757]